MLALRDLGATVVYLSLPDAPDLLIGFREKTYLFETKSEHGKLRKGQTMWLENWRGGPVTVIRSLDDALVALGLEG